MNKEILSPSPDLGGKLYQLLETTQFYLESSLSSISVHKYSKSHSALEPANVGILNLCEIIINNYKYPLLLYVILFIHFIKY